nr:transposase, MuDR [Tanacetum cinerariifolium]
MKIHRGGRFTNLPRNKYVDGEVAFMDSIDINQLVNHALNVDEVGRSKILRHQNDEGEGEAIDEGNHDQAENEDGGQGEDYEADYRGESEEDEANDEGNVDDAKESAKRKCLRKLIKEARNSTLKTSFFVGKEFANRDLAKEMVRAHAAKNRRNIMIVKKDKIRIRVKCFGVVPVTVKMTKQMMMNIGKETLDHGKKVEGDTK